jgi:hypothetical protein
MADARPIKEIVIICKHCREPFNSTIFYKTVEAYESSLSSGVKQVCPHCRKPTPCDRENMTYLLA